MAKVTKYYATLYQQEYPNTRGQPLATHVDHFQINDEIPSWAEVEKSVQSLFPHKLGGHTHLFANHFKMWLCEAYLGEGATPPCPNLECGCRLLT